MVRALLAFVNILKRPLYWFVGLVVVGSLIDSYGWSTASCATASGVIGNTVLLIVGAIGGLTLWTAMACP